MIGAILAWEPIMIAWVNAVRVQQRLAQAMDVYQPKLGQQLSADLIAPSTTCAVFTSRFSSAAQPPAFVLTLTVATKRLKLCSIVGRVFHRATLVAREQETESAVLMSMVSSISLELREVQETAEHGTVTPWDKAWSTVLTGPGDFQSGMPASLQGLAQSTHGMTTPAECWRSSAACIACQDRLIKAVF